MLALFTAAPAHGEDAATPLPRDNFGGVGMIEMPSARFAPSGELSVGASFFKNTQHYNLGYEIFPWLEGSFRYSGLQHFDPLYPVYYDRSFALKMRLWDETDFWPAFAVGANDVVGTGAYAGEYFVASKRLFENFDATVGMGFGRLGTADGFANPFGKLSRSFYNRTSFPNIVPGSTALNTLFHGPTAGIFGGLVYNTPIDGLSLITEYSSDGYKLEASRGSFVPKSQVNYGASYQLTDNIAFGLDWIYGTSISGNFSLRLDPTRPEYPTKIDIPPPPGAVRTTQEQQAALNALLQRPGGASALTLAHMQNKNDFVDALWRQGASITDISVRGETIAITVASRPSDILCRRLAVLASASDDVRILAISGAGGQHVRCIVPHMVRAEPAIFISGDPIRIIDADLPLQTIDASSVDRDPKAVRRSVLADAAKQHIAIHALTYGGGRATVYYSNTYYWAEKDAIDRLTRVLMAEMPGDVEVFRLIAVGATPQREFDVLRTPAERNLAQEEDLKLFDGPLTQTPAPLNNPVLAQADRAYYPHFYWNVFPQFRQQLFDPNNPFGIQLLGAGFVSLEILQGLTLNGEGELNVYDNFSTDRPSDSLLPHVRSDFVRYFSEGKNGIGQLDTEYRFRATPTVFGLIKAGILESMFDGAGGEILWRPEGARWGIGVDAYEVWQRQFDRLLGLQSYKAFTGHVALYYQAPWYNLNFALRAGEYLAGDRGLTVEITRRFSTGVEIGAFATKTNVSAAQFGEGSFDKGIIIRIPLGWAAPIESQAQFGLDLRPVQRDGGQRLAGDASLWDETRRTSEGEILNTLDQ